MYVKFAISSAREPATRTPLMPGFWNSRRLNLPTLLSAVFNLSALPPSVVVLIFFELILFRLDLLNPLKILAPSLTV